MHTPNAPSTALHEPYDRASSCGVQRPTAAAWAAALLALAMTTLAACSPVGGEPAGRLKLATTTSMYHIGLWDVLEPMFEREHGVDLLVLTGGTGQAIEAGKRGDVDVLTLHDEARERDFIADCHGVARYPISYNRFLIVGPESDPAGIRGLQPEAALLRIMERGQSEPEAVKFVSRGDWSGTHSREMLLWSMAGEDYEAVRSSGPWYMEAGAGMGAVLMMAYEKSAYTLTVSSTYEASRQRQTLAPLVDQGDVLLNIYSAIAVNPERHPGVNAEKAARLIEFLTSDDVQDIIGSLGVDDYGAPLLVPARDWGPAGEAPSSVIRDTRIGLCQ
ncbi:MAG: substrate-binding domain-containing protein [Chloroflexota bacterium]|nr:substrate-binding domain-containing protein [Chloroflexota bacterium]MDE2941445.1 substrate-binding domain-containing protein [Chloroflexota bacterium]MDE3267637.1 substrate-binding domain-containing protein [Chloroflexota bacterium]